MVAVTAREPARERTSQLDLSPSSCSCWRPTDLGPRGHSGRRTPRREPVAILPSLGSEHGLAQLGRELHDKDLHLVRRDDVAHPEEAVLDGPLELGSASRLEFELGIEAPTPECPSPGTPTDPMEFAPVSHLEQVETRLRNIESLAMMRSDAT